MRVETADEEKEDSLVQLFEDSVVYPGASNLIFYPREHFGEDYRDKAPSPEQVVDAVLAYKPIQQGLASSRPPLRRADACSQTNGMSHR